MVARTRVVVIGGGPAGIMAAITAADNGNNVILVEQNSIIGKKLSITGGGRCNLTNDSSPIDIMKNVVTNNKFLYKSLHNFTSRDLINLIEENGCPLKKEEEGRVYPVSDKSEDIIHVFNKLLNKKGVKLVLGYKIVEILVSSNKVTGVKDINGQVIDCDSVILATGGISYPQTGSTGEGHRISKVLGHIITSLRPSLVSVEVKEKWLTKIMGISFSNVIIRTKIANKTFKFNGDLLLTHYGISGPVVFKLSAYINKDNFSKKGHDIYIDLLPGFTYEDLKERIISPLKTNESILSFLIEYLPKNFVLQLLEVLDISKGTTLHQLMKSDRNKIIENIKNLPINILKLRDIKSAIVTAGGISVKEVNPSTMESRLIKGLFFAGEILDVDALTGGYNLQVAFSTGYLAGKMV